MSNSPDLFAALDAAHQEIQEERQQLDAREQALQRAREELSQALGGNGSTPAPPVRRQRPVKQKAAQHWLDAVSDLLARQGPMRQADIGHRLSVEMDRNVNSGTVALAVQQLEESGAIEQVGKDAGSTVWAKAQASSPRPRSRSTVRA